MYCPNHPEVKLRKARLDVYWCDKCKKAWLIHKMLTYNSFEDAGKVSDWEQLRMDFLSPLGTSEITTKSDKDE